ncbi:MAG: type VI secretion system tip protein VgrG, partial [bacterium]|nr:type VI secretion system tip protein VgrG [bacterium]
QYRETDYNFICRLMEEEGIRWYFEQTGEAATLILDDGDSGACAPIEGEAELPYLAPTGMVANQEHVFRFRLGQSVRPGAVKLNDFDFKNPGLDLKASSDCGRDADLEFFDCPGEYTEQSSGQDLAALRAEEFEAHRTVGVGQSNSPRLTPGRTFDLTEHTAGLDGSYLLTSVTHQGKQAATRTTTGGNGWGGILDARVHQSLVAARQNHDTTIRELAEALLQIISRIKTGDPTAHRALTDWVYHAGQVSSDIPSVAEASGANPLAALAVPNLLDDVATGSIIDRDAPIYECLFECMPATVSYRPSRVTPWPKMRGTQTARVVGPEGEEIHTDEYGRVKVQFHWDREGGHKETASCWIRVCQGMAGGGYGMMFLPRIGQEVVVDFLEGDPDKPLVIGRVYNADHMPPYKLPDEKTKSVIKTHSSKGGGGTNEIRFEDRKDSEQILLYAQKNLHIRANSDRVENIGHDRHLTVKENKFELVKKAKNIEVKLDFKEKIGGDKSLAVGGKVAEKFGGSHSVNVGGNVIEKYGQNHKNETTMTSATKALAIKQEASTCIELKCGGSSIVLTPAAIFIMGGPIVNINCGSGPPVGPVTAMASSPAAPDAPVDADSADPGKDTTYSGGEEPAEAEPPADVAGHEFEPTEIEEQETSWVEVELLDDQGRPVPYERYRVVTPEGKIKEGSLNKDGVAHVALSKPGDCEITFPNIDKEGWSR